ncbi:MAG TPA: S4 domain-containing protein, partial [Armatimonadota bacterium]|nr:S4 domain-containing protein [Armatimonadota bacterium]
MPGKVQRERLDLLLVQKGLFETRERAQAAILAGQVFVGGQRADKAGARYPADASIEVRGEAIPYVSRGGLKLAGALDAFQVD